ncbi:MAG: hypothetical protein II659_06710 [Bacteroidales bacterium]|nr:hypothetical protein [Bacteroidales bacterium]
MIENLLDIYSNEIPAFLYEIADSPQMQRLKGIGMNCGCEYTSFPLFKGLEPYSRFTHSLGVGAIVWNFTHDAKQAIAGILHDVASPAFAHVIDFMKGDYLVQESTEERTSSIIASSVQICRILKFLGLFVEDVSDYHLYPVADNDSPRLSADRLEYTMGNILNYKFGSLEDVKRFYGNLKVAENGEGQEEICFSDEQIAEEFAYKALECGKVYVCDADRYAMQYLSEIVRRAILRGTVTEDLLYTTERQVIDALVSDGEGEADWKRFCRLSATEAVGRRESGASVAGVAGVAVEAGEAGEGKADCKDYVYPVRMIRAKKRYIDPYVAGKGRVSELCTGFRNAVEKFKSFSFEYLLEGKSAL